jgi:hypothetical protein
MTITTITTITMAFFIGILSAHASGFILPLAPPQASDTRKPWRHISSNKQRSRTALRVPLTAARSFSTSAETRCLRSLIVLSHVRVVKIPTRPIAARGRFSNMGHFGSNCLVMQDNHCRCLAYLCYDSTPSGSSLLPDNTHRAKPPENPANTILSGQKGLLINGSAR